MDRDKKLIKERKRERERKRNIQNIGLSLFLLYIINVVYELFFDQSIYFSSS